MVGITALNVLIYARFASKPIILDSAQTYQILLRVLSFFYVLGCGLRAVLPRIDVERICYVDSFLSSTFIGRSFATVAEICFMTQLCVVVIRLANDIGTLGDQAGKHGIQTACVRIALIGKVLIAANFVAQGFCWMGVTTTKQIWHVYEESIWTVSVLLLSVCCLFMHHYVNKLHVPNLVAETHSVIVLMRGFIFCGALYVLYMLTVDIPLYYFRFQADEKRGAKYFTVTDGIADALKCHVVSQKYEVWKDDLSWITLYFSVAVWISLYIMITVPRVRGITKNKVQ